MVHSISANVFTQKLYENGLLFRRIITATSTPESASRSATAAAQNSLATLWLI